MFKCHTKEKHFSSLAFFFSSSYLWLCVAFCYRVAAFAPRLLTWLAVAALTSQHSTFFRSYASSLSTSHSSSSEEAFLHTRIVAIFMCGEMFHRLSIYRLITRHGWQRRRDSMPCSRGCWEVENTENALITISCECVTTPRNEMAGTTLLHVAMCWMLSLFFCFSRWCSNRLYQHYHSASRVSCCFHTRINLTTLISTLAKKKHQSSQAHHHGKTLVDVFHAHSLFIFVNARMEMNK